jgi:hypothetical protein
MLESLYDVLVLIAAMRPEARLRAIEFLCVAAAKLDIV